jgi:Skp family chaperone for outer membrane proteins
MRLIRLAQALSAILIFSTTMCAQQPPTNVPAGPIKGRIALINTAVLQEQIGEYRAKLEALNRQFEPRVKEVQTLIDRINALETTIKTQTGTLSPARVAEMTEQLGQMKRDHQRKTEDLQADAERARDQALAPLKEKLSKFLEDFTAKRGIVLLIDIANGIESNVLVWFDQRVDITQEFITEYNKANPVPAGAAGKP